MNVQFTEKEKQYIKNKGIRIDEFTSSATTRTLDPTNPKPTWRTKVENDDRKSYMIEYSGPNHVRTYIKNKGDNLPKMYNTLSDAYMAVKKLAVRGTK